MDAERLSDLVRLTYPAHANFLLPGVGCPEVDEAFPLAELFRQVVWGDLMTASPTS